MTDMHADKHADKDASTMPQQPSTTRHNRRSALGLAALGLLAWAGCHGGVTVNTNSRVSPVLPTAGPLQVHRVAQTGGASGERLALIDVDGLLLNTDFTGPYAQGENPVALFREKLDCAAADPCVRGVVVRINSPGGGVTATDVMWHDLQAFKQRTGLPVVACLMDLGTGGAYYLATAADLIVAHPTAVIGGIGVIINLYNMQQFLDERFIIPTPVKSGSLVDMGALTKMLDGTPEQALLQSMAQKFHLRFQAVVDESRGLSVAAREEAYDGRIFTARRAVELGLVDELGYVEDALARARELAGISSAQVVMLHRSADRARTIHAITPNVPLQSNLLPVSVPGFDRTKLPTFLYIWQVDPTIERLSGH